MKERGTGRKGEAARRGFTLVELVVVIGLIVLLAALAVSGGVAVITRSERRQTELALVQLQSALREWEQLSGRTLTWWNQGDPYGHFDVHASTPHVYILSEMLSVIARPEPVRGILSRIDPSMLHAFAKDDSFPWLPGGLVDDEFVGALTVLDAWGTPIYATHPGRLWKPEDGEASIERDDDGTINTPNEFDYGTCRNREIVFVSAGPDGLFGIDPELDAMSIPAAERYALRKKARSDNLYSGPVDFKHPEY